jgi:hypothetical protein
LQHWFFEQLIWKNTSSRSLEETLKSPNRSEFQKDNLKETNGHTRAIEYNPDEDRFTNLSPSITIFT